MEEIREELRVKESGSVLYSPYDSDVEKY